MSKMNSFKKWILRLAVKYIKKIVGEKYKASIVARINEKLDLPNMDEKEEAEFIGSAYDNFVEIAVAFIEEVANND